MILQYLLDAYLSNEINLTNYLHFQKTFNIFIQNLIGKHSNLIIINILTLFAYKI